MRLLALLGLLTTLKTVYGDDPSLYSDNGPNSTTLITSTTPTSLVETTIVINNPPSTDSPATTNTTLTSSGPIATPLPPVTGYNLRILPLGDSITYGAGSSSNTGYRGKLYQSLVDDGNNVTMIGTVTGGNISQPLSQGIWGSQISEIQNAAAPVLAQQPNIILLRMYSQIASTTESIGETNTDMLTVDAGTNNLNKYGQNPSVVIAAMSSLLDTIYGTCPNTTVVLSQIIPIWAKTVNIQVQQYNALLVNLTDAQLQIGRRIVLADSYTAFTSNNMSTDGLYCSTLNVHPNDAGYSLIADAFTQGLKQVAAKGWVSDPVPITTTPTRAQNRRRCYTMPNWFNQGQIFDGAGLGQSSFNGSSCTKGAVSGRCACTYGDGTKLSLNAVGFNCSAMSYPVIRATQFADIDGDGREDLVYISKTGGISVYLNTVSGFVFAGNATPIPGTRREYVQMADIDGDGRVDWLLVQPNGSIHAYLNTFANGVPSWSYQGVVFTGIAGVPGATIKVMDANGDQKADICIVTDIGSISCRLNQQFTAKKLATAAKATRITPAKFTAANRDSAFVSDMSGTGVRTDLFSIDRTSGALSLWWGRWDSYNVNAGMFIYSGVMLSAGVVNYPSNLILADLNGDARKDIVAINPLTSAVYWWRNDCGVFLPPATAFIL